MRTLGILKGLMVAAFVLLGVELLFRHVVFPDYTALQVDMYVRHPLFEHYNKPDLAVRRFNPGNWDVVNHTNSRGMRGREADRETELAGVWVGGDSNTFGGYVADDEVYVHRLRNLGYPAANLASEGHGMHHQAVVVRQLAAEGLKPRAVLIGLSMYNAIADFRESLSLLEGPLPKPVLPPVRSAGEILGEGFYRLWNEAPRGLKWIRALLIKNSAAYGWLKSGIMGVPVLRDWTRRVGLRADLDTTFNADLNLLRPYSDDNPATTLVASTADYAAAFGNWTRSNFAVPFGVILFPGYHELYPERFPRFMERAGLAGQDLDPKRPQAALAAALRERGVPVLDLGPILKVSGVEPLTFPDDAHLNPQAHAVVARAVADWLGKDLKVPPAP